MNYNHNNKTYNVEYAVILDGEDFEIWLQNPEDENDYLYIQDLPEDVQDDLYSKVQWDFEDSMKNNDFSSFVGYIE